MNVRDRRDSREQSSSADDRNGDFHLVFTPVEDRQPVAQVEETIELMRRSGVSEDAVDFAKRVLDQQASLERAR